MEIPSMIPFNQSFQETVMNLKIAAVFLSLTTGSMVAAGVAAAADRLDGDPGITVRYSRAELATPRGTALLYARLKLAAQQACPGGEALDPMRAVPGRACYDAALATAVAHIQQPRLTALHRRNSTRGFTASRGA